MSEAIQRTPSRVRNGQGDEPCREGTFIARWARLEKYFLINPERLDYLVAHSTENQKKYGKDGIRTHDADYST